MDYDNFEGSNRLRQREMVEELSIVMWPYHMTPSMIIGESPFSLAFGDKTIIPIELTHLITRIMMDSDFNEDELVKWMIKNDESQKLDLDLLEEKWDNSLIRRNDQRT